MTQPGEKIPEILQLFHEKEGFCNIHWHMNSKDPNCYVKANIYDPGMHYLPLISSFFCKGKREANEDEIQVSMP